MRLLIDGDACPDRQKVIELALHYGVEVLLLILHMLLKMKEFK